MGEIVGRVNFQIDEAVKNLNKLELKSETTAQSVAKAAQQASYGTAGIGSVALQTMNSMGTVGMAVAGSFMLITASIAGVVKGITSLAAKFNDVAKSAKSVDMTVNEFTALKHSVELAGADIGKVMNLITRLDNAIVQATDGNEQFQKTFSDLNLSWLEMYRLSPEKRLMAVVAAVRNLKKEGKELPTDFIEKIVGKRDVQTINKLAADENFEKNIIGLTARGLGFDESTVSQAEALSDAVQDVGDGFLAWISKLQTIKWLMENLKDVNKALAQQFTADANWKIDKQYASQAEGIGDVAEQMFTAGKFSVEQQRTMLAEQYKNSAVSSNLDPSLSLKILNQQLDALNNATDEEITQIFYKTFGKHIEDLNESAKNALFKAVAENDNRFDFNDRETWIQMKKNAPNFAQLTPENATEQLISNIDKLDTTKIKEVLNIEERIVEAEKQLNKELSKEQKSRIAAAAEAKNQLIIQQNIANINDTLVSKLEQANSLNSAKGFLNGSAGMTNLNPLEGNDISLQNTLDRLDNARTEISLIEKKNLLQQAGIEPNEKNLEIYKEQLKTLQQLTEKQRSINLLTGIKDSALSNRYTLMEKVGFGYQSRLEQNLNEAQNKKGSSLTINEENFVKQKTALDALIEKINNFSPADSIIHTNELARRGGMVGSTIVESDTLKKQLDFLRDISRASTMNNRLLTSINNSMNF